jgi:DNA polymerase-3 subunit delta'
VLDRSLLDLLSVYRDALVLHTGAPIDLVNQDHIAGVQHLAQAMSPEQLLHAIDAIGTARERIGLNVNPLLALEAMALSLRLPA